MKNLKWFIILFVALIVLTILGCSTPKEKETNFYALTAQVIDIDYLKDEVICADYDGNIWSFFGSEDWQINDFVSLLMDNNNTPMIYDDIIMSARYSGTGNFD